MTRGQLPKAYLRIDPNIDQTHPDNLDDFIRLLCTANRQPRRGWFRSRAVLLSTFGKAVTTRLYARGDVVDSDDGVQVPGWETWQEGDLDVGERVRRFRAKHALQSVTPAVTEPVTKPLPTSEASRRLGVKALDALTGDTARATLEEQRWEQPEGEALTWLAARGCDIRPGNGYHQKLVLAVENHGINAVVGMFDRLEGAGVKKGDIKGYLFGAIDALNGKPDLRGLEREERAEADSDRIARSVAKTKAMTAEREKLAQS